MVLTPGDNEWADCHRRSAGGHSPPERLAALRRVFSPVAGRTLGRRPIRVQSQALVRGPLPALVENQMWWRGGVVFATVHVVGSSDGLDPWFGAPSPSATQLADRDRRLAANLLWIDRAFAHAARIRARGVVVMGHANLWAGRPSANAPLVDRIARHASAFGRPVLLVQADTHRYLADRPLTTGSPAHGVTVAAPNVVRIVVPGGQRLAWVRLIVEPGTARVFRWGVVPV